jgi:hypothetical protein
MTTFTIQNSDSQDRRDIEECSCGTCDECSRLDAEFASWLASEQPGAAEARMMRAARAEAI